MKPITREEIATLYQQGWSKQEAKVHLKRQAAKDSLLLLQQQYLWDNGHSSELMDIMAYILDNMVVKS
jgi:hypothetical protein